jgi:Uma2 family endonuclease
MSTIDIEKPTLQCPIPEAANVAVHKRLFTVSEYAIMGETGILSHHERTELIGGEVILMSPMGPRHALLVRRLTAYLSNQVGQQAIVSPQCPLQLDTYSEPEPDLVLLRNRPDEYGTKHPRGEDVLLLIEVSDSTLEFDRAEKTPRYAKAGIPELWIVDLKQQQIEQYSQPNQGKYDKKVVCKVTDEIRSLGSPIIAIQVGKLFA